MNAPHDKAMPAASYGFHCVLQPQTFAQGVALVTEALKAEGFGILSEIGRVAHEVRQRLERVRSALGGSAC